MKKFAGMGKSMMIADKYFRMYLKSELAEYNLNAAEGMVLHMMFVKHDAFISDGGSEEEFCGYTQEEIIREIHSDKGVMTRTMKSLEEKDFVMRKDNPSDSRSFLFSITEQGMNIRNVLSDILKKWNSIIIEGIEEENLIIIGNSLEMMAENASRFFSEYSQRKTQKKEN